VGKSYRTSLHRNNSRAALAISGLDVAGVATQQIGTIAEQRITDDTASVDLGKRNLGSQRGGALDADRTMNLSGRLDLDVVDEVSDVIWMLLTMMKKKPAIP
jgi:hypothetical protein